MATEFEIEISDDDASFEIEIDDVEPSRQQATKTTPKRAKAASSVKVTKATPKRNTNKKAVEVEVEIESEEEIDDVIELREADETNDMRLYRNMKARDQMLERPNMWIGSALRKMREIWGFSNGGLQRIETDTPPALERLFMEMTANYCDHLCKTRRKGYQTGEVKVTVKGRTVSSKNYGMPMPIGLGETGIPIPEECFGLLFSGSNFKNDIEEDGHDGGANGVGVKAANIMSDFFEVIVKNHVEGKIYKQTWYNNMSDPEPAELTEVEGMKRSSVCVTYRVEMERFGYEKGADYTPEAIALFWRHTADASFSAKITTYFNGYKMNYGRLIDYARLYFGDFKNYIYHYQWREEAEVIKRRDGTEYDRHASLPLVEMIVVDGPNQGHTIGMANSILNSDGGVHVDVAQAAALRPLIEELNNSGQPKKKVMAKGNFKKGKAKAPPKKKDEKRVILPTITMRDAKPHFRFLVSVRVVKPDWDGGQSKTRLNGPPPEINIPLTKLNAIKSWQSYRALMEILDGKRGNVLSKTDGRHQRKLGEIKNDDAGDAGTKHSNLCTLIGVEGDSAYTYLTYMISYHPLKRKRIGGIVFRGKLINAYKNKPTALAANNELVMLKKMLGIMENVDYTLPENKRKLRYGKFMIMADADIDGSHIRGLILAMFTRLWGSILDTEFVQIYQTPIKRARLGKQCIRFFFEHEFMEWKENTPGWKRYVINYYKGLGGSSKKEVGDDFRDPHIYTMVQDERAQQQISLAFGPTSADRRKRWIAQPTHPYAIPNDEGQIFISEFVDTELKQYSINSLLRHIPKRDGLRIVNRKALFTSFRIWKRNAKPKEEAMTSFVADVIKKAKYHNGDAIDGVVKRMCMDFVGSNNVPYFIGHGGLGTRVCGGKKAASSRYLKVKPNAWWLNGVFRPEDDAILDYTFDEGIQTEPEFYLPIIPMALINEVWSVATGYSSYIPAHHPLDIIDYYIRRIRDTSFLSIKPWYRGFRGEIDIIDRRKLDISDSSGSDSDTETESISEDEEPQPEFDDEEDIPDVPKNRPKKNQRYSMITTGSMYQQDGVITVTELPVGVWTRKYKNFLFKLEAAGRIKDFNDNNCDDVEVGFEITGYGNIDKYHTEPMIMGKEIGLTRSYGLTNLVLLDDNSRPIRFYSLDCILNDFYKWRLPFYNKRRLNMIEKATEAAKAAREKAAFIDAVLSGNLLIRNEKRNTSRKRDLVMADIEKLGLNPKYYNEITSAGFNREKVAELYNLIAELEEKQTQLESSEPEDMWLADLSDLRRLYIKHYKDDRPSREIGDFIID